MLCLYHKKDLDGICSAMIVKLFNNDAILYGVDYDELEIPDNLLQNEKDIVIVDFSFSKDIMLNFNKNYNLIWIDHHLTSLNFINENNFKANKGQLVEINYAACELTWKYFFPKHDIPLPVILIGRYDVWDHFYSSHVVPFQYSMTVILNKTIDMDLCNLFFNINEIELYKYVYIGEQIKKYKEITNKICSEKLIFNCNFHNYKALIINQYKFNSLDFSLCSPYINNYDILLSYVYNGKYYLISIYAVANNDIDVSKLAKLYKGGGHKKAAGFICNNIKFENNNLIIE